MESYRNRAAQNQRIRRKKKKRKHILVFTLILLLLIMAGVLIVLSLVSKIDEIKNHPLEHIAVNEGLADGHLKNYTNIVVFHYLSEYQQQNPRCETDLDLPGYLHTD